MAKTNVLNNYYVFYSSNPPSPITSRASLLFITRLHRYPPQASCNFGIASFFLRSVGMTPLEGRPRRAHIVRGIMGTGHTRGFLQFVRLSIFGEVQLEPQYTLVCMKHLILVPWNSSRIITGVANANFLYYYIKSVVTNYSVRHGTLFHLHATRSSATETE